MCSLLPRFFSRTFPLLTLSLILGGSACAQQSSASALAQCGIDVRPEDVANGSYGGYVTWPEMVDGMKEWIAKYPGLIRCQSLGKSYEGRDIPLLKISGNPDVDGAKPQLLFVVGVHPREQAPSVAIMRFVSELLENYGKDPETKKLLDNRVFWLVPMLNVDGKIYDFKKGDGAMQGADWRKNRHDNGDGTYGIDLNRNFPVRWGSARAYQRSWRASTTDTKGNIYEGKSAASEPETQALMRFIKSHPLRVMLDFHSPLHEILCPPYLSSREQPVYQQMLDGMRATQKEPYPVSVLKPGESEPSDEGRGGDSGISYTWSYYATGAYSFNIEYGAPVTGIRGRYPDVSYIETEYDANIRGPLMYLLRKSGDLPLAGKGSAKLASAKTDAAPQPGTTVFWKPQIQGEYQYAVLTSENPVAVVKAEFRLSSNAKGFPLEIQADAKPGTVVPLSLYVWTSDRKVSELHSSVTVSPKAP